MLAGMNAPVTKLGRPTSYTSEMAERICKAVARSKSGLRKTLEDDPELPALGCVQEWLVKYPDFASGYAYAKDTQLRAMAEDIIDISGDQDLDPNERRLMVDTRKWLLSKLIPRTYGDKLDLTSGGEALPASSLTIDQRIQSIMMAAEARSRGLVEALDGDALKLLE